MLLAIRHRIPRVQGQSDITFTAEAIRTASTHQKAWSRPPISVDFQVLMFTASGLLVRFLKVFEKNNYNSVKWVRYLTKANGTYQIRVSGLVKSSQVRSSQSGRVGPSPDSPTHPTDRPEAGRGEEKVQMDGWIRYRTDDMTAQDGNTSTHAQPPDARISPLRTLY